MRALTAYPTDYPLPTPSNDGNPQASGAFKVEPEQVAAFDALLHDLHPEAERVDAARIMRLTAWLSSLPPDEARAVLDERLSRIEELRAMVDDPDWDCAEPDCANVRRLLRYLDQDDDLIPDTVPLFGKLDDVLLLELAWPAVADEAEEYRDFVQFRETSHPDGDGPQRRAAWIADRMAALSMLRQQMRANDGLHLNDGRRESRFRIV